MPAGRILKLTKNAPVVSFLYQQKYKKPNLLIFAKILKT